MRDKIELEKLKRRGWDEANITKLDTALIKEIARRDSAASESTDPISVIVQVRRAGDLQGNIEDENLKKVLAKITSFSQSPKKNWLTNSVAAEISATQIKEMAKDPRVTHIEFNGPIVQA